MPQASHAAPELELGFYLIGDIPESSELERLFGVRPAVTHRAGEPRFHGKSGAQIGAHWETVWGFTSAHIQSNEVQPHVEWLLSTASPARKLLDARPNAAAFIEVALAGGGSTVLPQSLVKFAGELKAEIGFVARRGHAA
jgi:hypothetical protein